MSDAAAAMTGEPRPPRSRRWAKRLLRAGAVLILVITLGLLLPQPVSMPVEGATPRDWHRDTFWYEPWGASGVHKGIDIFASRGTPVLATTYGVVLFSGEFGNGGRVVLALGPKWQVHYYAHLGSVAVEQGALLSSGQVLGTVGDSGNAVGKPAHLHYSVLTLVPRPWAITNATQGWKRAFYLDPGVLLARTPTGRVS